MILFLFLKSLNYSIEITFANQLKNKMDLYYNLCSSLNLMINEYYYAKGETFINYDWIFLLKKPVKKNNNEYEIPPVTDTYELNNLNDMNEIIKLLRRALKHYIQVRLALKHQQQKELDMIISNNFRMKEDYRYTIGSLKTTNKTHKQRTKNLYYMYESLNEKYESIYDVFEKLKCLIISKSTIWLKKQQDILIKEKNGLFETILDEAWEACGKPEITPN